MSKTFTYIIRSPTTANVTQNNINMTLTGLPSEVRYFDAELQGLYIPKVTFQSNAANSNFIELKGYGMDIIGRDSNGVNNTSLNTVGITTLNNDYGFETYKFRVGNFNGANINFRLETGDGSTLWTNGAGTFNWILVLRLTPVEE